MPAGLCAATSEEKIAAGLEKAQQAYDRRFIGHTRDEVITYYGAPSHTVKMDDGRRVIEYASHRSYVLRNNRRQAEHCTMRFWLTDQRVSHIDQIGDKIVCLHFATTKERISTLDARDE